jgi:hypothetical protein
MQIIESSILPFIIISPSEIEATTPFPRQRYRAREFRVQIDLSLLEQNVLSEIHRLDTGAASGCHVHNVELAEKLRITVARLRKALQVLTARGYLVTLGFDDIQEVAFRRVRLRYAIIPGVIGTYTMVPGKRGRMKKRWRTSKEPNPSICRREELWARLLELRAKRSPRSSTPATSSPGSSEGIRGPASIANPP